MGLAVLLFWGLLIGGVVWLVTSFTHHGRQPERYIGGGESRALDILRERYARGEITREQFEEMRRDLEQR